MPRLRELQAELRRAVLAGEHGPALEAAIAGDGLTAGARLAIYRHHVVDTLTRVLEAAYPVVGRIVDPRFFGYAASRYIAAHPPAGPCLSEYGASFAEFLAGFPPCRDLVYLPDVARLEWAVHRAWHAPDAAALDSALLGAIGGDRLGVMALRLHPSVSLIASPWPIDEIWRSAQADDPAWTVDLDRGDARLEVRRAGDRVRLDGLDAAGYAFRQALASGRRLETAALAALALDPSFDLAAALRDLVAGGGVVGVALDSTITTEQTEDAA
jgi:hypothetical protein